MDTAAPQWKWPSDLDSQDDHSQNGQPVYRRRHYARPEASTAGSEQSDPADLPEETTPEPQPTRRRRYYKPRKCRICLEDVLPTTDLDDSLAGRVFGARARVRYVSEDSELGRLMSPCLCKGSQKYVHEGCLQAWRNAMPSDARHFYRCPTCGFEYRMERLRWSRWLSSTTLRAVLTALVMLVTIFVLGFIADPFMAYLSEGSSGSILWSWGDDLDHVPLSVPFEDVDPEGWLVHFIKGFLSLGVLGFFNSLASLGWFSRYSIERGYRNRRRGRDTMDWNSWFVVAVGVVTFVFGSWKFVSKISSRLLEKASDRVMDVQGDDGPDEDEEDDYDEE
ncbi:putative E3 ubiquitin-protein ligase [Cladorrhinum sp. PSN259]|nr:putative E3 ubiquitin-protein ligase [Cladorrhinum sp. PSN259]